MEPTITKIVKPILPKREDSMPCLRRVAVYARVSTDHEEQKTSLEAQKMYLSRMVELKGGWELAGVYADDGITGTSWKKRASFQRMMKDCEAGKIDLVITKSVSRFARNTVDSIKAVRKLQSLGVVVYFEKENIWTNDSKGEFVLTLMSSLAQEESRSISENTKWGMRKRFADGFYSVPYRRFLGYDQAGRCSMVVNRKEAVTVRWIYKWFLQGLTAHSIAGKLTKQAVKTPGGCDVWSASSVRSILTNEKYKGDALLQKRFFLDFLSKKPCKNEGQLPRYYVTDGHEAIIAPEVFDYVQVQMEERKKRSSRYSGGSIFASKFVCSHCGAPYFPKPEHSTDKYHKTTWMCSRRFRKKTSSAICGIRNTRIPATAVRQVFAAIAQAALTTHPAAMKVCRQILEELDLDDVAESLGADSSNEDCEDLALIIHRIVVFPDGHVEAELISGETVSVDLVASGLPVTTGDKLMKPKKKRIKKGRCLQCGKRLQQAEGRKKKKFCSDACRNKWWNSHLDRVNRKAWHEVTCQHCGKTFKAYGNQERKYCGVECYRAARKRGK